MSAPDEAPVTLAAEPSEGTAELTTPDGSPSEALAKVGWCKSKPVSKATCLSA